MTRGLLFDLYGVVMRHQSPEAVAAIERAAGYGGPELWDAYWSLRDPYDHGQQDGREYWATVARAAGREIADLAAVEQAEIDSWTGIDAEMADYVRGLARRCPVGVLSNVPENLCQVLERDQPWLAELTSVTLSARIGLGKPDLRAYQIAVAALGQDADDVLFIDDRQANVDGAVAAGLRGVVFTDLASLRPVVEEHLAG